jgi:hypothetical protein
MVERPFLNATINILWLYLEGDGEGSSPSVSIKRT